MTPKTRIILPPMTDKEKEIFQKIHTAFADAGYTYDMAMEFIEDYITESFTHMALKCKMSAHSPELPGIKWEHATIQGCSCQCSDSDHSHSDQ